MDKIRRLLILLVIISLTFLSFVSSTPSINSVTGAVVHKDNLTISGTDFGIKDPARPLMWDDGEDETAGAEPECMEPMKEKLPQLP